MKLWVYSDIAQEHEELVGIRMRLRSTLGDFKDNMRQH